jgi:serine-type anaerobic sulfatase-maturating enzyme
VPGACVFAESCGGALALEHNGDLYSCDHYVEPCCKSGNIRQAHMIELLTSPAQLKFGQDKRDTLPRYCRQCEVRFACHGEYPKNRFINTTAKRGSTISLPDTKLPSNISTGPMKMVAELLRGGRYADEMMGMLAQEERRAIANVGAMICVHAAAVASPNGATGGGDEGRETREKECRGRVASNQDGIILGTICRLCRR